MPLELSFSELPNEIPVQVTASNPMRRQEFYTWALIDTGASITLVDERFNRERLKCLPFGDEPVQVDAIGDTQDGGIHEVSLHLLEIVLRSGNDTITRRIPAGVMPLGRRFIRGNGPTNDVYILLGMDFLKNFNIFYTIERDGGAKFTLSEP